LTRNPFFTFINCLGLSLGMAVFTILWQYSNQGLQSEHFIPDHENIARVGLRASWTDDKTNWQESLLGFANARVPSKLANDYREIKSFTRIFNQKDFSKHIMHYHDKEIFISYSDEFGIKHSFIEPDMIYADKNLFNFFGLPLSRGNPDNVLRFPNNIVISEKEAKKYFGDSDPVGKNLVLNDSLPLIVSGVFKDLPGNTHLDFDMVMSMERIENSLNEFGMQAVTHSYIKMQAGTETIRLAKKINAELKDFITKSAWGDWNYGRAELFFQKLDNAPFESYRFDYYKTKSKYIFEILRYASIIILLMAWINYINLSLSANAKRIKELAIRKAAGARYSDTIAQFLTEAVIINFISLIMGILLLICARYPLEKWFQFQIPHWSNISLSIFLILSLAFIAGILLTGVYPAMISLKHSPKNLFGMFKAGKPGHALGNYFTSFQFAIAIILLIWMSTVFHQMNFILNKNLGLDKENTLILDLPINQGATFATDLKYFAEQVSRLPGIQSYSSSQSVPCDGNEQRISAKRSADDPGIEVATNGGCDEKFIPFYKIQLLAGRNFIQDNPSDRNAIILSKAAAQRLGFAKPEDAIGQRIYSEDHERVEVIGVINDYKLQPFLTQGVDLSYQGNPGIALTYEDFIAPRNKMKKIAIRIDRANFESTIGGIEKIFRAAFSDQPFNWYFLDELIDSRYASYRIALNQIIFYAAIATIIACLGFLGMIASKAREKTKEIGIRKVLGANHHQIVFVLLNTTLKQVLIASLIAIPAAWWLTRIYLDNFSERVQQQWWYYVMPILGLISMMLITVAFRLRKAILTNPVESLKHE